MQTIDFATMTIPDILAQYPETAGVFDRLGIRTEGYQSLYYEDLSATCRVHHWEVGEVVTQLQGALPASAGAKAKRAGAKKARA